MGCKLLPTAPRVLGRKLKMTKITLESKMSNSGSVYDLAAQGRDITINFGASGQYCVIAPAFYNMRPSVHRSADAAVKKAKSLSAYGPTIISRNGDTYLIVAFDELLVYEKSKFEVTC